MTVVVEHLDLAPDAIRQLKKSRAQASFHVVNAFSHNTVNDFGAELVKERREPSRLPPPKHWFG